MALGTNRGRVPKDIGQINFVLQQWSNPCRAPWYVYVETAYPALLQMGISLLCWDWSDVARWFFKPVGKRYNSHFRGRRKGERRKRNLGWAERARKITPGMSSFGARRVSQGVSTLWRVDGIVQKYIWYYVFYDVVRQGVYNWTSMLYRTEYCQMDASGGGLAVTGTTTSLPAIAGWVDLQMSETDYQYGVVAWSGVVAQLGLGSWIVSSAVKLTRYTRDDAEFEHRLILDKGGAVQVVSQGARDVETAASEGTVNFTRVQGPVNIKLQARVDLGFVDTEQMLWVMQRPEDIPGPDFEECKTIPVDPPSGA